MLSVIKKLKHKIMKRLFLVIFSFTFSTFSLFAQDFADMDPQERAGMQTSRMTERLGLNEDQETKVYQINLANLLKTDSLRTLVREGQIDRSEMFMVFRDMQMERDKEMKAILTEEQMPAYEEMKQEMMSRFGERRGNRDRQKKKKDKKEGGN